MKRIFTLQKHPLRAAKQTLWALIGCVTLGAPGIAAPAPVSPAQQCLTDLAAFDATMSKDGYWIDGAGIVNAKNENLGTVEDILMSPSTGKIAYLVVGHGGFWGMDEAYSPVPWTDFKSTAGTNMLILPVTKATVDASPQVRKDIFDGKMDFAALGSQVDTYWTAHPPVAMN